MAEAETQESGHGASGVERLLTVAELAVILRMSEAWVRKGVLERTIPFTKMGRSVRFTRKQVAMIVAQGSGFPLSRTAAGRIAEPPGPACSRLRSGAEHRRARM